MKKRYLVVLFAVICLAVLTACGGRKGEGENQHPAAGNSGKTQGSSSGSSGAEPLKDDNELPADGIITKEQFATVTGQDREIKFTGEADGGIRYIWTCNAAQILNPADQNLKIDFESKNLDDIKKQANNANDALKMTMHGSGLTMKEPWLTRRLIDKIKYERKGIMLDLGHYMNTNSRLRTAEDAVAYVHRMLDRHEKAGIPITDWIRGIHLQMSLGGKYKMRQERAYSF